MDDQEIISRVMKLKKDASDSRQKLESDFKLYWEMYNGKLSSAVDGDWRSKLYMKETFKSIDAIHPVFMDMLFMKGNPYRIAGVDGTVDDQQAMIYERLIKVYIEKMDAYITMDDFVRDELIYGTAFAKMYWDYKTVEYEDTEIYETEEQNSVMGIPLRGKKKAKRNVKKKRISRNVPRLERVDYKDIFVGTRSTNLQEFPVIHRTWQSYDQLVAKNDACMYSTGVSLYDNLKDVKRYLEGGQGRDADQQETITNEQNQQIGLSENTPEAKYLELNEAGDIEILEYWTADNSRIYTVAGGLVLIRNASNPFSHHLKPFLYANYIRRPGSIFGIGVCELCAQGQELLNTSVRQQVDNNTLANNITLLADRAADIDFDQIKTNPGGVILCDKEPNERLLDKITQLNFTKVNAGDLINLAISEIQEVSGAGRMMQGTYESGAIRSSGQARMMMGASGKRIGGKVVTHEEMFLKPFVRMLYGLMQQFLTENEIINVMGQQEDLKYVKISRLDIMKDLDFTPVGSRQLIEMEQTVHQMNNFLAITAGDPDAKFLINKRYLYKKIWNNISPDHDGDKVILSDKEAARSYQEQKGLMEQGMADQAGGTRQAGLGGMNPSQPNMAGGVQ